MNREPGFNIYEFKKWLSDHMEVTDSPDFKMDRSRLEKDPLIGASVILKTTETDIASKVENVDGVKEKIILEFLTSGGKILNNYGKRVVVEVSSGTFSIPRFCIKVNK